MFFLEKTMNDKTQIADFLYFYDFSGTSPNSIGSSIMPGLSSPPTTSASHMGGMNPGMPPHSSAPFSPQHIAGFSPPSLFSR